MSIRFEAVSKSFGQKTILDKVSFSVLKKEILFILGQSGVGKSVTLKHIVGFLQPDSGKVFVDDAQVNGLKGQALAKSRLKCGMVFQHPALFDSLTVFENIAFGLGTPQYVAEFGLLSEEKVRRKVEECLKLVHLPKTVLESFPHELSYGMQKRVSLARTIAPGPSVLLFDEPTTGLDPVTTAVVHKLIQELSRVLSVTCIVVSHDMDGALSTADRIIILEKGRILTDASPADLLQSEIPLVTEFLAETKQKRGITL